MTPSSGRQQMKMTVFGASGDTGTQVVAQALDAGHDVLAVVRDPARLAVPARPNLEVVVADVMDPGSIIGAVTGRLAVGSANGARGRPRQPPAVCTGRARSHPQPMAAGGSRAGAGV